MNHESQQQFDPENAPAFERLRDRRRAKRRRMLRVALTLLVCAALLGATRITEFQNFSRYSGLFKSTVVYWLKDTISGINFKFTFSEI